ncbi:MAG: DUF362 domain-containing protein [Candidatus Aminicenantes bacterium]|nr:DUF362 domain-containing protein [Candidatus Aminicenantes bacterium]
MKRRDFLKKTAAVSTALSFPAFFNLEGAAGDSLVVKVSGESPYEITKRAVKELGGMGKFISKQDVVMVKPNIAWNRSVEQAGNTNPEVVGAVVEMVLEAGAKKVIVMDHTTHKAPSSYKRSGIEAAAKKAGAEVRHADENRLIVHDFKGRVLKRWPVFKDHLEVDKFINLPILKHHGSSVLTIAMKNLYGIIGGNRGKLHRKMGDNIADLANGFKTHLTIVDAYRVLLRNGPTGGRLSDVELKKTVIACANIMEADVVAADLFGKSPQEVPFIQAAFERKMGNMELDKINIKSFKV